jgi:hypothetical protein
MQLFWRTERQKSLAPVRQQLTQRRCPMPMKKKPGRKTTKSKPKLKSTMKKKATKKTKKK